MTIEIYDKELGLIEIEPFIAPIETDLILARSNAKAQVNQFAGDAIFAKYPVYKQLNDPTEFVMRTYIDGIRAESNIANNNIDNESDIQTVMDIANDFYLYTQGL